MSENIYQPPQADLAVEGEADSEFYVVSLKKFLILFIGTFGMYSLYWFYENWKRYKATNKKDLWAVMRAIFSVFFTHALFRLVNEKQKKIEPDYSWKPETLATTYVSFVVVGYIADRLSGRGIGEPYIDLIAVLTLPVTGWCLYQAQKAVNIACGDIDGSSNARITILNMFWVLLGCLFWALIVFGIYAILVGL